MTTRSRRDRARVRIRTYGEISTQVKEQTLTQREQPEPEPEAAVQVMEPPEQAIATGQPEREIPQPVEEALHAKDLVSVGEILANPVLTPNEVGTLLRVSPETVMALAQDGELPTLQVEKETRMLRIDVLKFIRDLRSQRDEAQLWHDDNPRFGGTE